MIGLIGFGASSLLCGLAPNMELLIVFRLVQGAAGAFLGAGLAGDPDQRILWRGAGRAFGIWAGASSATAILGPLVGGLLVST
jgi:MFS family permease